MKVAVINGSPKGQRSITLQSVLYLKKYFPGDSFGIIDAGAGIRRLEKDFSDAARVLAQADLVLFCYPVYTFLAPSQMHRFVELMKERCPGALSGKCAAQFTTSKHFYDITAHRFVEDNCRDLGMAWLKGLSADMDDLQCARGRRELAGWWRYVHFLSSRRDPGAPPVEADAPYDVAVVADMDGDSVLEGLVAEFTRCCPAKVRVVNLRNFPFKGGCLGCFRCASDGKCVYTDGFGDFLREQVLGASAVVYAFRVKDHSMGSLFKMYDDRQFCNGHRMMTIGMPVGYLVAGNLDGEENLRTVIEARADVGRNVLCGVYWTEGGMVSSLRTASVQELSDRIVYALNSRLRLPQSFYGVGGTKIFRDLIYLMRGLMRADHEFYKREGIYDDFPQRHRWKMLQMKLIGFLMNNRSLRSKMGSRMDEGMLAPYRKAMECPPEDM